MKNRDDFVVKDGILTAYQGYGGDVVIPGGVREIDTMLSAPAGI